MQKAPGKSLPPIHFTHLLNEVVNVFVEDECGEMSADHEKGEVENIPSPPRIPPPKNVHFAKQSGFSPASISCSSAK